MRKSLSVVVLATVNLAACAVAGTAIYRWLENGDKVSCIANEFTFGCATTLGWVLSAVGVVVFAGGIYLWERTRGS